MDGTASLGFAIAFTAGLLSFLSPCVLPLIPSYLTFITGLGLDDVQQSRRAALVHALLFVAGFTLIFLALGATATALGRLLVVHRGWIAGVGGAMVIVFGCYLLGLFDLGAFSRERRVHLADKPVGYLGTVLVGIAFGAGWTPCIGPILGSILVYTSQSADMAHGLALLLAYSLGLAIPFLLAAAAMQHFLTVSRWLRAHLVWVNRFAGTLLVAVGILMMTGGFTRMAGWLQALTPAFLRARI